MTNTNIETNIPFGYISANSLDSNIVSELLDDGVNVTAQECYEDWREGKIEELLESGECETRDEAEDTADCDADEFWQRYEDYEPQIEGERDGVKYASSWLGGALNFFILHSPHITETAQECSPCVPGAGNLDCTGGYRCYDVPPDWRRKED